MRLCLPILALLIAPPVLGQGLTVTLSQIDATGKKSPEILHAERSRARLDLPNGAKLLYDSATRKVQVMLPGSPTYVELTPQFVQILSAGLRGQPAPGPVTYRSTGMSRVGQWPCTTYDGMRGSEKVVELCAAEGNATGLSAMDFEIVRQAIDAVKGAIPPGVLDAVPIYGTTAVQGYAGFPVRRTTFVNGKADSTVELVEIKRGAIPEAIFAVPVAPAVPNANPPR